MSEEPQKLEETGRNPDGTFKDGHDKVPGSGRPKNTLKDFLRRKFNNMSDIEKEEFLKQVSPVMQFRMAEGNPHQTEDVTSDGEKIIPIYGTISRYKRNEEGIQPEQKDQGS